MSNYIHTTNTSTSKLPLTPATQSTTSSITPFTTPYSAASVTSSAKSSTAASVTSSTAPSAISPIFSKQLQSATGKIDFTFTNDYMFRAILQSNETVLRGLIGSLLHLKLNEIQSVEIRNPIILGEEIKDKSFILDIQVLLNNNTYINLEMQVQDNGNWTDRSLSYLCRNFDQLYRGQNYEDALPTIHIGILDYDLFPDLPEFFATNMLINVKNYKIFNDKFILNVLSLNQINLATDSDKLWFIDTWAKLFKSTTWEDIKMIAQNNSTLATAAESLYEYNTDDIIRQRCRAREEYERHERTVNKKINDLTMALAQKDNLIASLLAQIEELKGNNP